MKQTLISQDLHFQKSRCRLNGWVLLCHQLQNGSQDFDFFNCYGCRLFIWAEFHLDLSLHIFWTTNLFLGSMSYFIRKYSNLLRNDHFIKAKSDTVLIKKNIFSSSWGYRWFQTHIFPSGLLVFSQVSSKFLAMCNITLYSVYHIHTIIVL